MPKIHFLLGFDTESPYAHPLNDKTRKEQTTTLDTVFNLNTVLDHYHAPRTYFILGKFLEETYDAHGQLNLQDAFCTNNPLVDIQQHTYSHQTFRTIPTRPDRTPLTPKQVHEDLVLANPVIDSILGKNPIGVRAPLGYAKGLTTDSALQDAVKNAGMHYISSDLRDNAWGINPPLVDNDTIRQPRTYPNGLIEIPGHGWHDTVFLGSKTINVPPFPTWPKKELEQFIVNHYCQLLQDAHKLAIQHDHDMYVGASFHPQAIHVYDPHQDLLKRILDYAYTHNVELTTFTHAASSFFVKKITL